MDYSPFRKQWRVAPGQPDVEERLRASTGLHPITARLLAQRGVADPAAADRFLKPSLDDLADPLLLPDAEPACARIASALDRREQILVHGDYDADGVCAAAILTRCLRRLGGAVEVFIPDRVQDGYDIRAPAIERAADAGVTLILTADCGIQRVVEVQYARQRGIDVVITDHHLPLASGEIPDAVAVVNPQREGSTYPFADMCGAGVAFRLCEALVERLGHDGSVFRRAYLDLAAIGTVSDVMPLAGENRVIVKHGLEALAQTRKAGLRALLQLSRTGAALSEPLDTGCIAYGLGPRLNAASRTGSSRPAMDLLLATDEAHARELAAHLDRCNTDRRATQDQVVAAALEQLAGRDLAAARCVVVSGPGWPPGIVGLAASKLVELTNRPAIVIGVDPATGTGRGSARSIPAFNLIGAIDACSDLLLEHGGHRLAAGLGIAADQIPAFAGRMEELAREALEAADLVPCIDVNAAVRPEEVTADLVEELERLAPFGVGNPEPCLMTGDMLVVDARPVGKENRHLKLALRASNALGTVTDAVWFGNGARIEAFRPGTRIDICFTPRVDSWNGRKRVQFVIADARTSSPEASGATRLP